MLSIFTSLFKPSASNKVLASVPEDIGSDVLKLQKALKEKGFDPGPLDGVMGAKTKKAIALFQKSIGLEGSGEVGPKTLAALSLTVEVKNPVTGKGAITSDFKGKKDRHLHPNKRLQIEAVLFPEGQIPFAWKQYNLQQMMIDVANAMGKLGFKESNGNNMGKDVGEIQGTTGEQAPGGNGDAWCLDFAQMAIAMIEDFVGVESPVPATAHCVTCWNGAIQIQGLTSKHFVAGTLCLGQRLPSDDGHAMLAIKQTGPDTMATVEGNTSIKNMTDGDGSGFKIRNIKVNDSLVTLGFVYPYPMFNVPRGAKVWN